ncbi:MAG: nuclear transport factor 2 family protein [Sphingomonas sp.]
MMSLVPAIVIVAQSAAPAIAAAPQDDEQAVHAADDAFWHAFNACDAASMGKFLTDDVEFYHDITGLTRSRDALVASMMKGPCGTPGLHLRRALIEGSETFQRIPGYGAVTTGDHLFYARHGHGPEQAATDARFLVVWKQESGKWLMARIISYDHRPVPYRAPEASIVLTPDQLARYVGRYHTDQNGDIDIALEDGVLVLRSGNLRVTLGASAPNSFFARERDLRFTFSGTPRPTTIAVEENGAVVATGSRIAAAPPPEPDRAK